MMELRQRPSILGSRLRSNRSHRPAWRVTLEERGLGRRRSFIRMSAIRKLAVEATDNGLLAPELAAGIARVKSAKSIGVRGGNWLSLKQAQALLNAPDITTTKGLRDRAIIAVLLGCALRRSAVAALTDGRWSGGFTPAATSPHGTRIRRSR